MALQGNNTRPLCIKDPSGDDVPEGNTVLAQCCLYDGATVTTEYRQKWSLIILHQGRSQSQSSTVEISPVCYAISIKRSL